MNEWFHCVVDLYIVENFEWPLFSPISLRKTIKLDFGSWRENVMRIRRREFSMIFSDELLSHWISSIQIHVGYTHLEMYYINLAI